MEASTKVSTIHFNQNATHKGFNQTFPGGLVGGWVVAWLEIQLGQNFGNKKKVGLTQRDRYPHPQKILGLKFCWVILSFCR